MEKKVLHDFQAETIDEKTRWFRSLKIEERANNLIMFTEMALALNPELGMKKDVKPLQGRVLVLSKSYRSLYCYRGNRCCSAFYFLTAAKPNLSVRTDMEITVIKTPV